MNVAAAGISVSEIAQAVRGSLEGNAAVRIEGAASLDEATERHISFFANPKYVAQLEKTKAGAILFPANANGLTPPAGSTLIRVSNPPLAYAQVLALFERQKQRHPKPGIHPSAVISPGADLAPDVAIGALTVVEEGARIGAGTVIYSGCYIGARAVVGEKCLIYPHVVLREDTQLGARVIIQPGAVIGSDGYGFTMQGETHYKIPQIGKVVLEDDVEIGANATLDRATTGETRIGAGSKIDNLVQIGHNVQIGKNCLVVAQVGISGSTRIGNQVTLAGQAGVVGHITIGDGAVIGAQAGVIGNVKPKTVLWGTPARPHREMMKLLGVFGRLSEIYDTVKALKKKFL